MPDSWARYLLSDGRTRVCAAILTHAVEEGRTRHGCGAMASVALGRTMLSATLLASTMREQCRVNLQIVGNGPLGSAAVEATGGGTVRGSIRRPGVRLPMASGGRPSVAAGLGHEGLLHVLLDPLGREYARGTCALVNGEVDDDVLHYLTQSVQVHSALGNEVRLEEGGERVTLAAGVLVQTLPGATPKWVDQAQQLLGHGGITALLAGGTVQSPHELAQRVFPGEDLSFLEAKEVRWFCPCSKDRVVSALATLGHAEVKSMLEEQGKAEATCDFCRSVYSVQRGELEELLVTLTPATTQAS